ncbi:hypothetical protein D3C85_1403880 [compost metagenome]
MTDVFRHQKSTRIVGARQHHRELFAAITGRKVTGALDVALDDCADPAQTLIAGYMTIAIIEALEVIDIDHQHGEVGLRAPCAAHFSEDKHIELTPVRQTGQGVLKGQQFQAAIDLNEFFLGIEQHTLDVMLLLHDMNEAVTEPAQKQQQR